MNNKILGEITIDPNQSGNSFSRMIGATLAATTLSIVILLKSVVFLFIWNNLLYDKLGIITLAHAFAFSAIITLFTVKLSAKSHIENVINLILIMICFVAVTYIFNYL